MSPGEARVSVVAADGTGRRGQQSFDVLVPNRPPVVLRGISGVVGTVRLRGGSIFDLFRHFSDPDGQGLRYSAEFDAAAVRVSFDVAFMLVEIIAKGTSTVVVTATDPGGLQATLSFPVTGWNRAPLAAGTVPEQILEAGDTFTVDAAPHFSDPDGDELTFSAASTDTLVAAVEVSESVVTVTGVAPGTVTVKVTATDDEGLKASLPFTVRVTVPD